MPITMKELALNTTISATAAASATTLYTAPALTRAHITAFTASNVTAGAQTLTVWVLASGGAPASTGPVAVLNVPANSTVIVSDALGHIVPVAGAIRAISTSGTLTLSNISGFEIT